MAYIRAARSANATVDSVTELLLAKSDPTL